jgi:hypothetical protein
VLIKIPFSYFCNASETTLPQIGANEAAVDQWFGQKGLQYIREHPWRTLGSGFRKIGAAFSWSPSPLKSFRPNLVHVLSYGPVMALGLWGMWAGRRNWREHLIFYALFVSFVAVTAVFFGHTNYRAYLDLYWIIFAAGALHQLRNPQRLALAFRRLAVRLKTRRTCPIPATGERSVAVEH